jgi:fatty acid-binding protein DegV
MIGIVTDSSCDLPDDLVEALGIEVVPLSIRFGDEELIDREQLTTAEFWARCATSSELPSTAAPSPGRFEQAYRDLVARGADGIVVVTLSGALSATMQSAELAARTVAADGIDVRLVDSRSVSLGLGTIAQACAEAARDGADIDTIENLRKGGRIGNAKALLATALSIKPLIEVANGVVEQHGKQRTRSKALTFLVDKVASYRGRIDYLAVLHADCSDVDAFVERLQPLTDGEIVVGQIGPVIGTHAGRGAIGVAFHERR